MDKTIEEAMQTIQAAEKLSFLSEQQLYDMEKQYRLQEQRLLEVQTMLQLKEAENRKLKKKIQEVEQIQQEQEERMEAERVKEQWRMVQPEGQPVLPETPTGFGYGRFAIPA